MSDGVFTLDLSEKFRRLSRPPIVEAVIEWQARAQKNLELESLRTTLSAKLPMYPKLAPIEVFGLSAKLSAEDESPVVRHHKQRFVGLRLTSEDGCNRVQFQRDGLVFSRTKPYEHWQPFIEAAKEAWRVFMEIAAPVETQRLGVRFINHIVGATPETLRNFLSDPPTCPSNLPLREFVYQSTFAVPGHPFGVRVIKVMQPPMPELLRSTGLFLDIDVYTTKAVPNDSAALDDALAHMRWLKDKVFFTLLTEDAVQSFA